MTLTSNPNIRGSVDVVSRFGLSGWAADDQTPERKVVVLVHVDDEVVCAAVGNKFRSDLADAGIGSGHHAFSCLFPTPINSASLKRLRVSADGQDLPLAQLELRAIVYLFCPLGLARVSI